MLNRKRNIHHQKIYNHRDLELRNINIADTVYRHYPPAILSRTSITPSYPED